MTNYTVADLGQILVGFLLFAPFALFPGYVIGWISDALFFRSRSIGEKLLIAVPLSISTVPLLIYLIGRFGSMLLVWVVIATAGAGFVILFGRDLRRQWRTLAGTGLPVLAAVCWIFIGLASLVDFQWNDRLYLAASGFDYAIRTAVTDAIGRTGVVPSNPFFFPGYAVPMRYHYFWFLPCSMVDILGGNWVGPGQAMVAGTLWCGLGLMCLVVLYTWYFRSTTGIRSGARAWTAIGLLGVTGLDIIPNLLLMDFFGTVYSSSEQWNESVSAWANSVIWVPHHVAGAISGLVGFLALWTSATRSRAALAWAVAIAGMAFACGVGLSVYVTFVVAASMAGFAAVALWKRWWNDAVAIIGAGALSIVLAFPYLHNLAGGLKTGTGAATGLFSPTVRSFTFVQRVLDNLHVGWPVIAAVNAFLLPLNYALELGLLFLVGVVQIKRYKRRRAELGRKEWAELVLIVIPLLICTFLRSSVIENNDLGWRGFLIPQFVLLLWSIDYVRFAFRNYRLRVSSQPTATVSLPLLRRWILIGVWLGLAGTIYAVAINRIFLPGVDFGRIGFGNWFFAPDVMNGQRTLALRHTYDWLDHHLPPSAVLLENPGYEDHFYGLYGKRQTVALDLGCGTSFGGSMDACMTILPPILLLFDGRSSGDMTGVESVCRRSLASVIVVKDLDPVWSDSRSWVWHGKPIYSNSFSKVFACPAM